MSTQDSNRCECGCGGATKGPPQRFISGHNVRKRVRYIEEDRGYETPCWIWQLGINPKGHGLTWAPERGCFRLAHRVQHELKHGPLPSSVHLHHRCEVPSCVNPMHLQPVTPAQHRQIHSKLTWEDVREIRRLRSEPRPVLATVLADRYGVTPQYIGQIAAGKKTWKSS